MKSDEGLVGAYIEYSSTVPSREFRKYWEHNQTPTGEILDLIDTDPDRAANVITKIAAEIDGNEKLETTLICGPIYDFEHSAKDKYDTILLKKLEPYSIFKYLKPNRA